MSKNEKPLVLVADDEPSTLALVANHLRGRGYRVVEATDGDEAWNAACRELPDIVVLDVMMPGMSGWEVCRKIRDAVSLAHTGVVMLTGIGDTLNELTSPLYGADAYLDKPFQFAKLAELVETTLAARSGGKLGRPKKTSGPTTRLYKTSLDDDEEPRSESRPKTEKPPKSAGKAPAKKVKEAAEAVVEKVEKSVKKAVAKATKTVAEVIEKAAPAKKTAPTKVAKKVPAKKASTKKVPVKKAPAKKAPGKKAPPMKAPGKKAPGKKAPAKKAPGKKAPPVKAPGKKAPAKKAPGKKAPPVKAPGKKAPAKKAPGKKAPPVKAPGRKGTKKK